MVIRPIQWNLPHLAVGTSLLVVQQIVFAEDLPTGPSSAMIPPIDPATVCSAYWTAAAVDETTGLSLTTRAFAEDGMVCLAPGGG